MLCFIWQWCMHSFFALVIFLHCKTSCTKKLCKGANPYKHFKALLQTNRYMNYNNYCCRSSWTLFKHDLMKYIINNSVPKNIRKLTKTNKSHFSCSWSTLSKKAYFIMSIFLYYLWLRLKSFRLLFCSITPILVIISRSQELSFYVQGCSPFTQNCGNW